MPTNEEKARSVLCRTGQPGNLAARLTATEVDELAVVYDEAAANEVRLKELVAAFWGNRAKRLADEKASDETQDTADRFRNREAAGPTSNK